MEDLKKIRDEIDAIDYQIAQLYEKRLKAVRQVIQYKIKHHLPTLDAKREQEIISRNASWVEEPYRNCYMNLQKFIMEESKQFQEQEKENIE